MCVPFCFDPWFSIFTVHWSHLGRVLKSSRPSPLCPACPSQLGTRPGHECFSLPRGVWRPPLWDPDSSEGDLGRCRHLVALLLPVSWCPCSFKSRKSVLFFLLFFFPPCVFVFGLVFVAVCIFLAHLQLIWMENYLLKWVFLDVFLSLSTVF